MFRKLFKKRNTSNKDNSINTTYTKQNEEQKCDINIEEKDGYYIVTVNTYASINDFTTNEILDLISNNISWHNRMQKHYYGTYYIIQNENEIYNILVNDKVIRIGERIQFETYSHEKIITYDIKTNNFDYFQCKHNIHGSSYETLYYGSEENGFFIKELELSQEETKIEINSIFNNLSKYEFIKSLINIEELFQTINEKLNTKIELILK